MTYTHFFSHKHTLTVTQAHIAHTATCKVTHRHTVSHRHTHSFCHTHARTQEHTHTTHTYKHTHTHTHTQTHTHKHTHTQTHTHITAMMRNGLGHSLVGQREVTRY